MTETVSSQLNAWSTFYATMGTSAAALTGLVFIVITLVAGTERMRRSELGLATFTTPTVVHFCAVLYVAAVFIFPWRAYSGVAVLVGVCGVYGVIYVGTVIRATMRLDPELYVPDREDWTWFGIVPLLAYLAILGGAIVLPHAALQALFAVAGGVLLLMFTGIRNAWDVVTYIAIKSE
jgi:hypothetical protein